jgi:hypothetical protein
MSEIRSVTTQFSKRLYSQHVATPDILAYWDRQERLDTVTSSSAAWPRVCPHNPECQHRHITIRIHVLHRFVKVVGPIKTRVIIQAYQIVRPGHGRDSVSLLNKAFRSGISHDGAVRQRLTHVVGLPLSGTIVYHHNRDITKSQFHQAVHRL